MTLTELAIKRPSLIIVIFIALSLLGVFGYTQLQSELLPDINIPVISVITSYAGASANEVEAGVTKKVEDAVSAIDKVDGVYSYSREGVSMVIVEFLQDADLDVAIQDAQRKVGEISNELPEGVKIPRISKISINEQPVIRAGATSNMESRAFYNLLKEQIQPRLSRLPGVGLITLAGGTEREIKVNVDRGRLEGYGLSILQVTQAVQNANLDFPTGNIKDSDGQFVVRLAGKLGSLAELRALIVGKSSSGGDIRLTDVAEVEDGRKDPTSISRINGLTSVGILVQKQSDANAVNVCKLIREELSKLEKDYSGIGLKFDVAQDSSLFTIEAADAVKVDLGIAIILVAAVMLLFLHSLRNSMIVLVAIPASLISTFIGMWAFGFTLNLVTLLALSLVIGILVDDSIVVLENIYRHLEKGEDKRAAALKGRNEIGFTALSITLVDVVVFVPLALVSGVIGGIMREFAIVVVAATLMSLFVSFTLTPMLASRFSKLEQLSKGSLTGRFGEWFEAQYRRLTRLYLESLGWSIKHWIAVTVLAVLMFGAAIALIPSGFIGSEFVPQTDRSEFAVSLQMPPGVKLEQTNALTRQVEELLAKISEVKKVFTNVGGGNGMVGRTSNNISQLQVVLVDKKERRRSTMDIAQEIRKTVLQRLPGVICRVSPVSLWGTAEGAPIELIMSGNNWEDVFEAAQAAMVTIKNIPGTADVRLSAAEANPEIRVSIDREKMAALGLSVADVGSVLRVSLSGDDRSKFRDHDGTEYDTRIILDPHDRSRTSEIGNLTIVNRWGQPVALKQFVRIEPGVGPTELQRFDRSYSITIYSQAIGRPSGTISADIEKALKKVKFPPGVNFRYSGDVEQQEKAFASLGLALLAAIIFVYLIMVGLYDSFIYPFVVLFAVPLAVTGALLALALTMNSLNIFTILGVIMQIGLVSKNAILLVDFTNQARLEGMEIEAALREAGKERLRPILMTTLTMIFGMMPIALSTAAGAEFKQGLGWALIGGLTFSMFMTLVLVPVIYLKIDRLRHAFIRFASKETVGAVNRRKA
jgi:HAE1 family hydrophobic/amphiphilic exporter-1